MKTFTVSDIEHQRGKDWMVTHAKTCSTVAVMRAADPTVRVSPASWAFTNTGIGICVAIQCECGESKDVTDYDHW